MTPAEQYLARRLADHPAWRWVEGMRAVGAASNGSIAIRVATAVHKGYVPDLADPATQGGLLAMLPVPRVSVYGTGEAVVTAGYETRCEGSTLGEALARAWLAVQGGRDG